MQYKLDVLLEKALQDWPSVVDLGEVTYSSTDPKKHQVKELYFLLEKISQKHIGTCDEVIFRNLHEAIYCTLHTCAEYLNLVRTKDMKPQKIKERFEISLNAARSIKELGYTPEDLALIDKYFSHNL